MEKLIEKRNAYLKEIHDYEDIITRLYHKVELLNEIIDEEVDEYYDDEEEDDDYEEEEEVYEEEQEDEAPAVQPVEEQPKEEVKEIKTTISYVGG